jgi:hypothetical protein
MGQSQPKRSDEQQPGRGSKPQLSLARTPLEAHQDAVWLTACAWCRRINVRDVWLESAAALELMGVAAPLLTHGICPTCFGEVWRQRASA